MDEPAAPIDDPGWLAAFDGEDTPPAAAPVEGEPLGVLAERFASYLALFVGTGLVAGAFTRLPGATAIAVALGLAGVGVFAGAAVRGEHTTRDPVGVACAVALALGLGALVGGVQDLGSPERARVLLPIGLALSCAGLAVQRGVDLRGTAGSTLVAGVLVAAFVVHHGLGAVAAAPQAGDAPKPPARPERAAAPAAAHPRADVATPSHGADEEAGHAPAEDAAPRPHAPAKAAPAKADHAPAKKEHAPTHGDHAGGHDDHAKAGQEHHAAPAAADPAPAASRGFEFLSPADEAEIEALERAAVKSALAGGVR